MDDELARLDAELMEEAEQAAQDQQLRLLAALKMESLPGVAEARAAQNSPASPTLP